MSTKSLVGRYEILDEIGRGAMATVYLARSTDLHMLVALKKLSQIDEATVAERFLREARTLADLNHLSNIVAVYEYLEVDGTPYIAMEYVDGGTLKAHIGNRLTLPQVAGALDGILTGLSHAHARGIVHRDLKPDNVLVTADGSVKLADFGIARALDSAVSLLTGRGWAIGTPAYMAPEQAMGEEIGPHTDLYAVGILAYELVSGRLPFDASQTPQKIAMQHAYDPAPPLHDINPQLEPTLVRWVERLLQKEPAARPESAAEAADELDDIVSRLSGQRWRREGRLPAVLTPIPAEAERVMDTPPIGVQLPNDVPPEPPPTPDDSTRPEYLTVAKGGPASAAEAERVMDTPPIGVQLPKDVPPEPPPAPRDSTGPEYLTVAKGGPAPAPSAPVREQEEAILPPPRPPTPPTVPPVMPVPPPVDEESGADPTAPPSSRPRRTGGEESAPPRLEGHTFKHKLGYGGYSDVYLYERQAPKMDVAVKVLKASAVTAEARDQLAAEANAMAQLSGHPYIVKIFEVAVAGDGRPYIVMQYYAGGNYSVRAKGNGISVTEALATGIQIASAVQTAHDMGLLHRDIKPANILLDEYDHPGLTDFGIAAVAHRETEAEGMSPPWAPPEVLDGNSAGALSDVYSLAATIWHLLIGRSPFEKPGGDNSELALMRRIKSDPVPPTGRPDVPGSLNRVLQAGMAKSPQDRPQSAVALARALQEVEQEMGYRMTKLELRQTARPQPPPQRRSDPDGTRRQVPQAIQAQAPPAPSRSRRRAKAAPLVTSAPLPEHEAQPPAAQGATRDAGGSRLRSRHAATPVPAATTTNRREAQAPPGEDEPAAEPAAGRNRKWLFVGLAATVVVAVAGAVTLVSGANSPSSPAGGTSTESHPQNPGGSVTPGTPRVRARVHPGNVQFTWGGYANALESDTFRYRQSGSGKARNGVASTPSLRVDAGKQAQVCLTVQVVRDDGTLPSQFSDVTCSR